MKYKTKQHDNMEFDFRYISIFLFSLFCILYIFIVHSANADSSKEIYKSYNKSVFMILTEQVNEDTKTVEYGTAFSIDQTGYLLTAAHLIESLEKNIGHTTVKDQEGNTYPIIKVEWIDNKVDLAVIKILGKFKPLPLVSQKEVEIGEEITVISNPIGLQNTVSKGTFSARREKDSLTYVQLTNAISPGSSGGPIFNDKGQVIAVVQGILEDKHTQNLNFGIPIDYLPEKYKQLNSKYFPAINTPPDIKPELNTDLQAENNSSDILKSYITYKRALILFEQSLVLYGQKNYEESIKRLEQAIQVKPDYMEAYLLKEIITHSVTSLANKDENQIKENISKEENKSLPATRTLTFVNFGFNQTNINATNANSK